MDSYPLNFGKEDLYIDLGAEAPIGAEKGERKIAIRDQELHREITDDRS